MSIEKIINSRRELKHYIAGLRNALDCYAAASAHSLYVRLVNELDGICVPFEAIAHAVSAHLQQSEDTLDALDKYLASLGVSESYDIDDRP